MSGNEKLNVSSAFMRCKIPAFGTKFHENVSVTFSWPLKSKRRKFFKMIFKKAKLQHQQLQQ